MQEYNCFYRWKEKHKCERINSTESTGSWPDSHNLFARFANNYWRRLSNINVNRTTRSSYEIYKSDFKIDYKWSKTTSIYIFLYIYRLLLLKILFDVF